MISNLIVSSKIPENPTKIWFNFNIPQKTDWKTEKKSARDHTGLQENL